MKDGYLSLTEAARLLPHGSRGYLNVLIRRGQLKAEKAGKFWYTTREWVDEYLRAHPELATKQFERQATTQPRAALAATASMDGLRLRLELAQARAQVAYLKEATANGALAARRSARQSSGAGGSFALKPTQLALVIPALLGFIGGLFLVALFVTIASSGVMKSGAGELRAALHATAEITEFPAGAGGVRDHEGNAVYGALERIIVGD
ncbi:MAG: helix-turn-helix domain-containing protein [bacterium]|nr:helix-turn-helix domain-containing protein [bacterium]MDZ4296584.1 helix-turn-helix domain-containing protein [Patescibacteria group bacterium]